MAAGHEPGERGGKCADAQPRALAFCGDGKLFASASWKRSAMASACSSRISPSRVSLRPPGRAVEQPGADLALQRSHLVGDRRLRQRELAGGPRERALVRDGAEGEHASADP